MSETWQVKQLKQSTKAGETQEVKLTKYTKGEQLQNKTWATTGCDRWDCNVEIKICVVKEHIMPTFYSGEWVAFC